MSKHNKTTCQQFLISCSPSQGQRADWDWELASVKEIVAHNTH